MRPGSALLSATSREWLTYAVFPRALTSRKWAHETEFSSTARPGPPASKSLLDCERGATSICSKSTTRQRKDSARRKAHLNEADVVVLCLPDAAAREAVALLDNTATRVLDASSAHRVAPGWTYGLPELNVGTTRCDPRRRSRVSVPGLLSDRLHPLRTTVDRRGRVIGVATAVGACGVRLFRRRPLDDRTLSRGGSARHHWRAARR